MREERSVAGPGASGLGDPHGLLSVLVLLSVLHGHGHVSHLRPVLLLDETKTPSQHRQTEGLPEAAMTLLEYSSGTRSPKVIVCSTDSSMFFSGEDDSLI